MPGEEIQKGGGPGIVAAIALAAAFLAVAVDAGAALGTRGGWWDFRAGISGLRYGAYLGTGSALLAAFAMARTAGTGRKGFAAAGVAIVLGLLALAVPGSYFWTAKQLPMIHDISTDTENPPRFVALLETRKHAPNGADYGGPEVAAKQRAAYPDIGTIAVAAPPADAFGRALATVRRLGWQLIDSDAGDGRIEATDTTRWFGFKDDVVIRVAGAPDGRGSRVDLRSVSRVGKSDIGKNAARIRAFARAFGQIPAS